MLRTVISPSIGELQIDSPLELVVDGTNAASMIGRGEQRIVIGRLQRRAREQFPEQRMITELGTIRQRQLGNLL